MKSWTSILLVITFFMGCKTTHDIAFDSILVTGHGGAGFDTYRNTMPPNTEAAVRQGLVLEGADAVEIDIQMTADSVLVLYHDTYLESRTTCKGCISQKTYGQLLACEVPHRHGPAGGSHRIPRLEDILEAFHDGNRVFYLNVKTPEACLVNDPDHRMRFARVIAQLLHRFDAQENAFIETYDLDMLKAVQAVDSSLSIIYDEDNVDKAVQVALEFGFEGIGVVNEAIDNEQVAAAQAQGLKVVIWGVRVLQGTKQAVAKSPDAIMTDDIRMLNNVLGR